MNNYNHLSPARWTFKRFPRPLSQGRKLDESISVARVRPRTSTVYDNDTMIGLERWLYCWSAIIRVLFPFCVTRQSPDAPDYILDRDHLALCPLVFSL
jgi:hypothetical protein